MCLGRRFMRLIRMWQPSGLLCDGGCAEDRGGSGAVGEGVVRRGLQGRRLFGAINHQTWCGLYFFLRFKRNFALQKIALNFNNLLLST